MLSALSMARVTAVVDRPPSAPSTPYLPLPHCCAPETVFKMALEEEAARNRERQEQQDGEVKQDAGAIELGDTTLSLPGDGGDGDTALPAESTPPHSEY